MARKMNKTIVELVKSTNEYLKIRKIKDQANDLFNHTTMILAKLDCYHGFLYYKTEWSDVLDRHASMTCNEDECEYLQFVIQ